MGETEVLLPGAPRGVKPELGEGGQGRLLGRGGVRGGRAELGLRDGRLSEGNALCGCSQARSCSVTLLNGEQRG